jgi:hypothetical protein
MRDYFQPGSGRRLLHGLCVALVIASALIIVAQPRDICGSDPSWWIGLLFGCL